MGERESIAFARRDVSHMRRAQFTGGPTALSSRAALCFFLLLLLSFWSDRRDAFNKSVCVCGEEGATQQDAFFHIISR